MYDLMLKISFHADGEIITTLLEFVRGLPRTLLMMDYGNLRFTTCCRIAMQLIDRNGRNRSISNDKFDKL